MGIFVSHHYHKCCVIGVSIDEVIWKLRDHLITTDDLSERLRITEAGHSYLMIWYEQAVEKGCHSSKKKPDSGTGSGRADLKQHQVGMYPQKMELTTQHNRYSVLIRCFPSSIKIN